MPNSNLVDLALNPVGNHDIARMNAFVRALHDELRCEPGKAVQVREFYGSMTTLRLEALGAAAMTRVLVGLGLNAASLIPDHEGADRLVILGHTLMKPFLIDEENGISYISLYFDFLARRSRALLAKGFLHEVPRSLAVA